MAEKTETKETKETKGSSGGLMPIVIMLAVAVVAVGAGFGLSRVLAPGEASADSDLQSEDDEEQLPEDTDIEGAEKEYYYHPLDPITINLNEPRMTRYVAATIVLAILKNDQEVAVKLIEDRRPRLRNSLNAYFSSRTLQDVGGEKNQNRIRREVRDLLNDQLGGGKPLIDQVLLDKFNIQ